MVNRVELKTGQLKDRVRSVEVGGKDLLGLIPEDKEFIVSYTPPNDPDVNVSLDIRDLTAPLGDVWKTLHSKKELNLLREIMLKYWACKGVPTIKSDVVIVDTDKGQDCITLRNKLIFGERKDTSLSTFMSKLDTSRIESQYPKTVICGDGDRAEFQFLHESGRVEVKPGDFIDPGIFVAINGKVRVSGGVSRLVCSNGLIRRMNVWEKETYDDIFHPSLLEEATRLTTWFAHTAMKKVMSVREVSATLSKDYPKNLLNKFWKSWAERVELKELTWYDVINDLTAAMNGTLREVRYNTISVADRMKSIDDGCRCPTCSTVVKASEKGE